MRILYLHQYFNTPDMSGGTRSYEMARRLVAAGHEVHMVTSERSRGSSRGWRTEVVDGITVHWYPVSYDNTMSFRRRILAFLAFAVAAARRATAVGGDVVFATSTPLTIAIPAVLAKRRLRVPMVFEVRDLWPEMPIAVGALENPLLRRAAYALERWAYRNSHAVVALSPGMAAGVVRTGYDRDRVTVIPNSCDLDLFDVGAEAGRAFRAQREWLGDRPLVLYAGTFGHVNDVSYLVRVAKEMAVIDPSVAFLAMGDGVEASKVKDLAAEAGVLDRTFFWEPPVPKVSMPAVLSAATVCTSLFAPIPEMESNSANKFFDALAASRPVAINYGGWQADLVRDNGMGVVLPREAREAAGRLADLLARPQGLQDAGRAARALGETVFGRDRLAAQLLDVLVTAGSGARDVPDQREVGSAAPPSSLR